MSDIERESFEKEIALHFVARNVGDSALIRKADGDYANPIIQMAWLIWQAAKQDVGEWVKCSDQLPPFNTPVFAGWFRDGIFQSAEYVRTDELDGWLWSYVYADDDWQCDDDYSHLTHWHYKPQPPREQS